MLQVHLDVISEARTRAGLCSTKMLELIHESTERRLEEVAHLGTHLLSQMALRLQALHELEQKLEAGTFPDSDASDEILASVVRATNELSDAFDRTHAASTAAFTNN
jgi:hypothetical protein